MYIELNRGSTHTLLVGVALGVWQLMTLKLLRLSCFCHLLYGYVALLKQLLQSFARA